MTKVRNRLYPNRNDHSFGDIITFSLKFQNQYLHFMNLKQSDSNTFEKQPTNLKHMGETTS